MKKCVLCLFGVIPRSIKYTIQSITENIINPLKKDFEVSIYVFNLNVGDVPVDGVLLDRTDISNIDYNFYEEYSQIELDSEIEKIKSTYDIKFRHDYSPQSIQNSLRQMYSESRIGKFLESTKDLYDIAIVCGPDYYIANPINLEHINDSIISKCLYLSLVNMGNGFTNGFYFGNPSVLIPILNRYNHLHQYFPTNKDYEFLVMKSVLINQIPYKFTDITFFKIRANKLVHWQGFFRMDYIHPLNRKYIMNQFLSLKNKGFHLHFYGRMTEDIMRSLISS